MSSNLLKIMEQTALRNASNCWNTQITFCLEKSGGERSNLHLNAVHIFNTLEN
jgi:hypothetical protein